MTHLLAILRLAALALVHLVTAPLAGLGWALRAVRPGAAARIQNLALRTWSRGVLGVVGMRVEVEGDRPRAPFFVVTNHLGYLDILVLGSHLDARFVSKAEVADWPVIGFLARCGGTIFLRRDHASDVGRALRAMTRALEAGHGCVFFPEGTSSPGERVLPFHSALFEAPVRAGVAVTCASLHYRTAPGAPPASQTICWWGDMTFPDHFYGLLRVPRSEARVVYGARLTPTTRRDLADRAHAAVGELFRPCGEVPA